MQIRLKRFKLDMNLSNSAYDLDASIVVSKQLTHIAQEISRGILSNTIKDINGNTIGDYDFEITTEERQAS